MIKDNSLLKMLENSMSDGVLYRFRDAEGDHGDVEEMLKVVKAFWEAVKQVFAGAWGLPSRKSRLMHGPASFPWDLSWMRLPTGSERWSD